MSYAYNGSGNYPTWLVGLWIDNDEGLYDDVMHVIAENRDQQTWIIVLALKGLFEENNPLTDGVYFDLLRHALDEVDWEDLVEKYLSEG